MRIPEKWRQFFHRESFEELKKKLDPKEFYPDKENLFKCFEYFNPGNTRAVFLFLSPYGKNWASGLAAAVPDREHLNPTLEMMLECISKDENMDKEDVLNNFDYTLEHWAKQGVLLLNCSLTVPKGGPADGHVDIWKPFMSYFIKSFAETYTGIPWVFFGKKPQFYSELVPISTHSKFNVCHPAATVYAKQNGEVPHNLDFPNSRTFGWVNDITQFLNDDQIQWTLPMEEKK